MDIFSSQQKLMRYRSYKGKKDYWTDLYYCLLISLVLRKPKENRKQYGCVSRGPYLFVLNTELDFHLSQHRLLGALPEHLWRMSTACLKMVCGQGGQSPLLQAPGNGNRLSGSLLTQHPTQGITGYQFSILLPYQSNNNCLAEFPGNKDKLFSNCHGHWQFMLIKVTPA